MGKKSKSETATAQASAGRENWVPGWFGGLTSPAAQKSAKEWHRDALRNRVLAFEASRRNGEKAEADSPPIFGR